MRRSCSQYERENQKAEHGLQLETCALGNSNFRQLKFLVLCAYLGMTVKTPCVMIL